MTELFVAGTEPATTCSMHERIAVDVRTGLRAGPDTPAEYVVERVYTLYPPEAQEWAREHGLPEPPPPLGTEGTDPLQPAPLPSDDGRPLVLSHPDEGDSYLLDSTLPRDAQKIAVTAHGGAGVTLREVSLYVDGRLLARFEAPPYKVLWQLEAGEHLFWAEGLDAEGELVRSEQVRVVVRE